jgi:hypothetical protein
LERHVRPTRVLRDGDVEPALIEPEADVVEVEEATQEGSVTGLPVKAEGEVPGLREREPADAVGVRHPEEVLCMDYRCGEEGERGEGGREEGVERPGHDRRR